MASRTWMTNSVKAGIVTAAIGAAGTVVSAMISKPNCPEPKVDPSCGQAVAYAGQLQSQGKPISAELQAKVNDCVGVAK